MTIMANNKIGIFDIKQKTNKILSWVLGAYLAFEALVECGDFIGLARVSSGPLAYGISRITQSGVGHVLLTLVVSGLLIYLWEMFRRSLKTVKSWTWYIVLALIALMTCDALLSLQPESTNFMDQLKNPSRFEDFAIRFKNASAGVQAILQIVLSIVLIIKNKARIRLFGIINLVCLFMSGFGTAKLYSFMVEHSVNFLSTGLAFGTVVFRYIIQVLPVIFLRRTMVYRHIKDADSSNDLQ